jgi:hypothetical protein
VKRWLRCRKARSVRKERQRLGRCVVRSDAENNEGLLRRAIMDTGFVTRIDVVTGIRGYVQVDLHDGWYTLVGWTRGGSFRSTAEQLREAMRRVVAYRKRQIREGGGA